MDPLATTFRSVGGSQEAFDILQHIGINTFDVVRHCSDSATEFAVAVLHMAAKHNLPTMSAGDEACLHELYRVTMGSRGARAAAFASANASILSPFGPAPDFKVSLRPPTEAQLVDLDDGESGGAELKVRVLEAAASIAHRSAHCSGCGVVRDHAADPEHSDGRPSSKPATVSWVGSQAPGESGTEWAAAGEVDDAR